MKRYKIQLETLNDVLGVIHAMRNANYPVYLTDHDRKKILSAHSLLGELTSFEFSDDAWVESEDDNLYELVKDYVI